MDCRNQIKHLEDDLDRERLHRQQEAEQSETEARERDEGIEPIGLPQHLPRLPFLLVR